MVTVFVTREEKYCVSDEGGRHINIPFVCCSSTVRYTLGDQPGRKWLDIIFLTQYSFLFRDSLRPVPEELWLALLNRTQHATIPVELL